MNRIRVTSVVLALALGAFLAGGCKSKPKLHGGARAGAGVGGVGDLPAVTAAGNTGAYGTDTAGVGESWQDASKALAPRTGGTITPCSERWASVVVYFGFDSSAIGPAEQPKLDTLAQHLQENPTYCAIVEGHCDERGSDEYNRGLGEKRALAVKEYLTTLGIDAGRLETVSYGEERPAVPNAQSEFDHQKNRRAEFVIGLRQ